MSKTFKLAFIAGDKSGPAFHDIFIPSVFFQIYNLIEPIILHTLELSVLQHVDAIHFQRQYAPESIIILRKLKSMGIPTISLVDDNVWEIPKTSPAYSTYQGDTLERFNTIVSEAHAVTTSTEYLASWCRKFNPNVFIFRNLVDPNIAKFKAEGRDDPEEIRLGWTGTPHHLGDIIPFRPVFKAIADQHPNVKFIFFGFLPPEIGKYVPPNRLEFYNFVPTDAFYAALANLDLDIGIAPLEGHPFNIGKTARKAQEYATLGISMVLADLEPYKAWKHGETCLKAKWDDTKEWALQLDLLIRNRPLRELMAKAAYDYVMENHDINKWIRERADVYYEIYRQVRGRSFHEAK